MSSRYKHYGKQFVQSGGSICPQCGERLYIKDYEVADHLDYRACAKRKFTCSKCKTEFVATYQLSGVDIATDWSHAYTPQHTWFKYNQALEQTDAHSKTIVDA